MHTEYSVLCVFSFYLWTIIGDWIPSWCFLVFSVKFLHPNPIIFLCCCCLQKHGYLGVSSTECASDISFCIHLQEWRHAHGMRCLGIPNTAHFANVTQIEDALACKCYDFFRYCPKVVSLLRNSGKVFRFVLCFWP